MLGVYNFTIKLSKVARYLMGSLGAKRWPSGAGRQASGCPRPHIRYPGGLGEGGESKREIVSFRFVCACVRECLRAVWWPSKLVN